MRTLLILTVLIATLDQGILLAESPSIAIWPDLAPGETSRETGMPRPPRNENPPVTRVEKIRRPTLEVYAAEQPTGIGVLILPGGGFNYVVTDKEGSDAAVILNRLGITAFVLRYRTKVDSEDPGWKGALQDAQRAMKFLRAHADKWQLEQDKIGLLGFSSGGQVASRLLGDQGELAYKPTDDVDKVSHRPDFSMLIYPWRIYVPETDSLVPEIKVTSSAPPTFIVHTHDDASSSLGSVLFYAALKKVGVDAELHVYENGGHGYGARPKPNSNIGSWPDRMVDWLKVRGLTDQ